MRLAGLFAMLAEQKGDSEFFPMKLNDLTWMIGGEAGFGIQSAGHILALAAARSGLHAFGTAEYPSLIRGGHNSDVIRIADRDVYVHKEELDLLLAMNLETLELHLKEIVPGGGVIFDGDVIKTETLSVPEGVKFFPIPLKKLAMEFGKSDITRNTVGMGATFGLIDFDLEMLNSILRQMFGKKGEQMVANNIAAAKAGYDFVKTHYAGQFDYQVHAVPDQPKRMLLTANDAICLGALKAGCTFVAEYPMTPSSSILHFMASHSKEYHVIVKHTEDEIAAMNMVVGAGWAGARAMTGTSGGGFSLMVEALGMAGMCEVPLVCVNVQRPGPSTGLPTRTEQGDLQFVLHASQGEFPRMVIVPGSYEESFYLTFDAFNLAEKYQMPVLILSDKHMAESVKTVEMFETEGLKIDRGKLLSQEQLDDLRAKSEQVVARLRHEEMNGKEADVSSKSAVLFSKKELAARGFGGVSAPENYLSPDGNFLRYKFTEDGISPRTIPGMPGGIHRAATDEHDETGDLTETPENRILMVEKRARKLEKALAELPAPQLVTVDARGKRCLWNRLNEHSSKPADLTFVTWGSPTEALLEVMEMLGKDGIRANMLPVVYMSPFHAREIGEILRGCQHPIGVEMNSEGQLCALITEKTGFFIHDKILKYSGRQFTAHEIYDRVKELGRGK